MHALFKGDTSRLSAGSGFQAALLRFLVLPRPEGRAYRAGGSGPRTDSYGAIRGMSPFGVGHMSNFPCADKQLLQPRRVRI